MLILRATKQLRDRVGGAPPAAGEESTTLLGDWYANLVRWRSPVVMLVNARTLLPVLTPLAPARTLPGRLADVVAEALAWHDVPEHLIAAEREAMADVRVAPTADRSVVGSMNDFIFLVGHHRQDTDDLRALSMRLAHVPCRPLRGGYRFPDLELAAVVEGAESVIGHGDHTVMPAAQFDEMTATVDAPEPMPALEALAAAPRRIVRR